MSKSSIYTSLLSCKIISVKDFISSNEKPYNIEFNKILSNNQLFDNISLLAENSINNKDIQFDKICAANPCTIPYATNIATSYKKGILYVSDTGNDASIKDNIKNLSIEGGMNIDDKIILIESIAKNDFTLNNIIQKITKYGGHVVGVIIILNQCEGEYADLSSSQYNNINIIPVLSIYDIFNHLDTNNQIELFYCERVKFYCEKITKLNIIKLL